MSAMLGSEPINLLPFGLLGFLGVKNGGRYPRDLHSSIQPMFEMLRWYVAANCLEVSSTSPAFQLVANEAGSTTHLITATTPTDLTTGGSLVVPQTEFWWVDRWSVNWVLNAQPGAEIDVCMVTTPTGGSSSVRVPATAGGYRTSSAAIARAGHVSMDTPIILRPGTIMSLVNLGYTDGGAGVNVNTQLRIARLPA